MIDWRLGAGDVDYFLLCSIANTQSLIAIPQVAEYARIEYTLLRYYPHSR
jgi:hypothetical protein